jgi:hypothetical protein
VIGPLRSLVNKAKTATTRRPTPFYVAGHERTGSHFVINTLIANAVVHPEYYTVPEWGGPYDSRGLNRFREADRLRAQWLELPQRISMIKTHCDRELFDIRFPKAKSVYLLRDPRDTLVSFFYFFQEPSFRSHQWGAQLEFSSMAEFLRRPLSPYLRFAHSLRGDGKTVADRWANHVKGWLGTPDTIVVRYEELKQDYRRVLGLLADFLTLDLLPFASPVGLHDRYSFAPRKGVIGDWRSHFTADDEAIVRDAVERAGLQWKAVTWRD